MEESLFWVARCLTKSCGSSYWEGGLNGNWGTSNSLCHRWPLWILAMWYRDSWFFHCLTYTGTFSPSVSPGCSNKGLGLKVQAVGWSLCESYKKERFTLKIMPLKTKKKWNRALLQETLSACDFQSKDRSSPGPWLNGKATFLPKVKSVWAKEGRREKYNTDR